MYNNNNTSRNNILSKYNEPVAIAKKNNLVKNNVYVNNNYNNVIKNRKLGIDKQRETDEYERNNRSDTTNEKLYNENIITNILRPIDRKQNNSEIIKKYEKKINDYKVNDKNKLNNEFRLTTKPYKVILKDKQITKDIDTITAEDLVVHKVNKIIDSDRDLFEIELAKKQNELLSHNLELSNTYDNNNKNDHIKNFYAKQSIIRNINYKENTFNENKDDYIEFYKKKQKENETKKKMYDDILKLLDDNIIDVRELPKKCD
jgi:hypothetical protein